MAKMHRVTSRKGNESIQGRFLYTRTLLASLLLLPELTSINKEEEHIIEKQEWATNQKKKKKKKMMEMNPNHWEWVMVS